VEVRLTPDEMSRMRDLVCRPLPPFLCLYTLRYADVLAHCRAYARAWLEAYVRRERRSGDRLKTFDELSRDVCEGLLLVCGTEASDPRRRALFLRLLERMGEHGSPTVSDVARVQELLLSYHGKTAEAVARDAVNEHYRQETYAPGTTKEW
jgi:hypothetical protein